MPRFTSSHPEHQRYEDAVSLHDSGQHFFLGTGTIVAEIPQTASLLCMLDVTLAGDAGDTLDVFIQTRQASPLLPPVWVDVVHFTQVDGNAVPANGAVRHFCAIGNLLGEAMFENATLLAAGAFRNLCGDQWRCRWEPSVNGTEDFTFSVGITPMG
jgi:hypothetical protein